MTIDHQTKAFEYIREGVKEFIRDYPEARDSEIRGAIADVFNSLDDIKEEIK